MDLIGEMVSLPKNLSKIGGWFLWFNIPQFARVLKPWNLGNLDGWWCNAIGCFICWFAGISGWGRSHSANQSMASAYQLAKVGISLSGVRGLMMSFSCLCRNKFFFFFFFFLHGIHQTNKIWASLLFDIASYHKKKLLTELISKKKVSTWPY